MAAVAAPPGPTQVTSTPLSRPRPMPGSLQMWGGGVVPCLHLPALFTLALERPCTAALHVERCEWCVALRSRDGPVPIVQPGRTSRKAEALPPGVRRLPHRPCRRRRSPACLLPLIMLLIATSAPYLPSFTGCNPAAWSGWP